MQQTRQHFNPLETSKYPPPTAKNVWCVRFPGGTHREATAKARLIVFCHAGGNSASFRPWDALITPEVALMVIELPGRLGRFREPVLTDVHTIVKQCVEQGLVSYLDRPFFLFGHSIGCLVAFEVARYLQKNFNISPLALFISSHESPLKPPSKFHMKSDKEMINALIVEFKDVQLEKVRREYPDLLEMVTKAIRADITAGETWTYVPGPVHCPMVVFRGQDEDAQIGAKDIQDWKAASTRPDKFEDKIFPGGHFYLTEHVDTFVPALNTYLKKFLADS